MPTKSSSPVNTKGRQAISVVATPATSVTDYHLLRHYGWRVETFNSEFMGSTIHMFYMRSSRSSPM